MGCDIHLAVEKNVSGQWQRAEDQKPNKYYGQYEGEPQFEYDRWYSGRNYDLFAMLADVRNGRGFAGVDTGDPVNPIDEPRGLPSDASAATRQWSDQYGVDGHSHSYLTVAELLAVDWQQKIVHRGDVGPQEFARWRSFGKPSSWSGSVDGAGIEHVSNEEMARRIDNLEVMTFGNRAEYIRKHGTPAKREPDAMFQSVYTRIQWSEPWVEAAGIEWAACLLRMVHLALAECGGDFTRVRTVFFFDN